MLNLHRDHSKTLKMMPDLVKLQQATKEYNRGDQSVMALKAIDLQIRPGEFLAVTGQSGSGKSTLLHILGCLEKVSAGKYFLGGENVSTLTDLQLSKIRAQRIGFVFQAYNLVPVLTAFENAEFVLALQGVERKERHRRTMKVLEEVGIADLADRRPDELSGGQQQRVAIARAIAPEPVIILADEPTANVDSANAAGLLNLMERLNREKNITFLFSTHDERVINRARRLIRLKDGELVSDQEVPR